MGHLKFEASSYTTIYPLSYYFFKYLNYKFSMAKFGKDSPLKKKCFNSPGNLLINRERSGSVVSA